MNEKTTPAPAGTQGTPQNIPAPGTHDDKNKTATMTPPANQPEKPSAAPSASPQVKPAPKV